MSTAEATTIEPRPKRQRLQGEALLAYVAGLVVEGKKPMQIAKKASIPYPVAAKLYEELYERVFGRVQSRYGPEVCQTMKEELIESNLATVRNCDAAVDRSIRDNKPNTRPYTHKNVAIRLLNSMLGFNAPTQIETTDRKVYALVNPAVHARIMADPKARAALLALEEFASQEAEAERGPIPAIYIAPPWEGGDG